MSDWIHRYKPAASRRSHVLLAACMWTAVGSGLLITGLAWNHWDQGAWALALLAAATAVGLVKAHLALRRTAGRMTDRIARRGDGRCLGGFLSWRMWLVVCGMILFGRLLRSSPVPEMLVAFVYQTVGIALLVGATTLWRAWSYMPAHS